MKAWDAAVPFAISATFNCGNEVQIEDWQVGEPLPDKHGVQGICQGQDLSTGGGASACTAMPLGNEILNKSWVLRVISNRETLCFGVVAMCGGANKAKVFRRLFPPGQPVLCTRRFAR